jgi:steroid delta-isomerase
MPTREHRSAVLRRYAETITNGDLEGVLALFADDASVEDPVGLPPITGAQRIREFYKFVIDGRARVTPGIIRTSAEPYMAAMPLEVEADRAGVVALVPEAGTLDAPSELKARGQVWKVEAVRAEGNIPDLVLCPQNNGAVKLSMRRPSRRPSAIPTGFGIQAVAGQRKQVRRLRVGSHFCPNFTDALPTTQMDRSTPGPPCRRLRW